MSRHTNNITAADVLKIKKRNDRLSGLKWGFIYGLFAGWAMLCLGILAEKPIEDYTNDVYFKGYFAGEKAGAESQAIGQPLLINGKYSEIELNTVIEDI